MKRFPYSAGRRQDGESFFDYAHRVLDYDKQSGVFRWKVSRNGNALAGSVAGYVNFEGYHCVRLERLWQAHRLAFFMVTGREADGEVDHINTIRDDNRWSNLREATDLVNAQNRKGPSVRNTTGFLGVSRSYGRFRSMIKAEGKTYCLGTYETAEEASEVYLQAKRRLHKGCTI